jgi:hypothetical protein
MSLNQFPTQNFQFITHSGPPKQKLIGRRKHPKTMPSEEHGDLELDEGPSTRSALDFDLVPGG